MAKTSMGQNIDIKAGSEPQSRQPIVPANQSSFIKTDTVPSQKKVAAADEQAALFDTTLVDYDEIFNELDALIDSLYMPRSFAVLNAGITMGYLHYSSASDTALNTKKQGIYSASFSYFHKSGIGFSSGVSMINDNGMLNPFQVSLTGSYDYIRSRKFITGVAFSQYLTKDGLPFYTSPLKNEVYGYFTYRKAWLKPSVSASYGWGNRTSYEEQEQQISVIRGKKIKLQTGTVQINSVEQIADFSVTTSVRHDFFFLHPFGKKDYFRVTPQLSLVSGTSQFGFNQTTTASPIGKGVGQGLGSSELFTSQNSTFENSMNFRPMSVTTFLKTEYVNRKFFVQPQLAVDYYIPETTNHFTASFLVNAGVVF